MMMGKKDYGTEKPWLADLETRVDFFEDQLMRYSGISIKEASYSTLLQHPLWKEKRLEILDKRGHLCEQCCDTEKLHVHHKKYLASEDGNLRMPWDYEDKYLQVLCERCHNLEHGMKTEEEELDDAIDSINADPIELNKKLHIKIKALERLSQVEIHPLLLRLCLLSLMIVESKRSFTFLVRDQRKKLKVSIEMINRCLNVHSSEFVTFYENKIRIAK